MRLLYAASISLLLAFPLTAQAVDRGVADFPVITPASDDYWVLLDTSTSSRYSKVATSGIRAAIGLAATDNPTFNSINITGSNIASANKQVTKAWTTGIGYTTNVTSVIHGGKHYICTSTHTAGSTTEPGVGASWATVWTVGTLGSATIYTQDTEPAGGVDGDIWVDTNGTTGQRLYTYEDTAWVVQAGGGGGYTNLTSFIAQTPWRLFYSNTDGDVVELGFGADGEYLKSNGAALAPSWATPSGAAHDAVTLGTDADVLLGLSTQQLTLDSQTANYIFAAPNGSAGDPTFRAIVAADIPALNQNTTGTAGGLSGAPNITVGTISAGATGFSVDADGDITAKSYLTSAADGARKSELPNNTTVSPTGGGVEEIYNEAGAIKAVENDTEYDIMLSRDIGSAIQAYDADLTTWAGVTPGTGVAAMLATAPGAEGGPTTTIEYGTSALGTSAISSGACASVVTTAATNVATTDVINWGFNGDPTGVTGYAASANGMLTIIAYPSSGNVNFKVCNNTAASVTPGAITLNWRIQR